MKFQHNFYPSLLEFFFERALPVAIFGSGFRFTFLGGDLSFRSGGASLEDSGGCESWVVSSLCPLFLVLRVGAGLKEVFVPPG